MPETMRAHVLYACDDAFFAPLCASMASLIDTTSMPLEIHIVSDGITDAHISFLEQLVAGSGGQHRICWHAAPDYAARIGEALDVRQYAPSMFSRFSLESLLPDDLNRIIYLDCDTIVADDIALLWNQPLEGKVVGAVNDCKSAGYARNLGLRAIPYVNSGVLVVDLGLFRTHGCEDRLFDALKRYNGMLEFPDNDLLCMVLQDEIILLSQRFNVTSVIAATCSQRELHLLRDPQLLISAEEYEEACGHPAVVHYTRCFLVEGRPWEAGCDHPLVDLYKRYAPVALGPSEMLASESFAHRLARTLPRPVTILLARIVHAHLKPLCQRIALRLRGVTYA